MWHWYSYSSHKNCKVTVEASGTLNSGLLPVMDGQLIIFNWINHHCFRHQGSIYQGVFDLQFGMIFLVFARMNVTGTISNEYTWHIFSWRNKEKISSEYLPLLELWLLVPAQYPNWTIARSSKHRQQQN